MRIGLVLSGGGAKGYAHIGLLKILDELKIKPDIVAGTSMGAVIGAAYCSGLNANEIENKIKEFNILKFLDLTLPKKGLIKGEKLLNFFEEFLGNKNFNNLEIPLLVNAIDLNTGKEIIFDKGNLSLAIRASMSIPGLVQPINIDKYTLVDGGVKNNIPISLIKDKCDIIITSNVNYLEETDSEIISANKINSTKTELPGLHKIIIKTMQIMQNNQNYIKYAKQNSDIFISPNLRNFTILDFHKSKQIISIGEKESLLYKNNIQRICKK